LAVTQPNMCGVGGDIFVLYYEAATRRVHFLNGAGRSGSRASLEELQRRGASALPIVGPMTVSVPGCVRGWAMLLERFGTRPLAALLEPAIHYAEGCPTSSLTSQSIDEFEKATSDAEWHRVFRRGDRAPALGEPLVQSDLARTIRDLAAEGPRCIGDPAHAWLPLAELLDKGYAARRRKAFDPRKAQAYTAGDPEGDTTGFVVVDRQGNVASVIQSLFNTFGSGIVVPDCGIVLQNRGRHFQLDPAHPSALGPRKRP